MVMGRNWKPEPRPVDPPPPTPPATPIAETAADALSDATRDAPTPLALIGLDGDDLDIAIAENILNGVRFDNIALLMNVKPWQLMAFMERSAQITEFYQLVKRTKAAILVDEAQEIADFFTIPPEVKRDAIAMRKWMAQILDPKTYNPQPVKGDGSPSFNLNISIGGKRSTLSIEQEPIDAEVIEDTKITTLPKMKGK